MAHNLIGGCSVTPQAMITASTNFWDAFWPNLWSGIIAGLVTGTIIGISLWKIQKHSDERRLKTDYELAWLATKELLPVALSRRDVISVDALDALPAPTAAVLEVIEDKPLQLWKHQLPQHTSSLNKLLKLRGRRDRYVATAEELKVQIQSAVREQNKDVWAGQDAACIIFINGRIYGAPDEKVMPWVKQRLDLPIERLREVAEAVLSQNDIKVQVASYQTYRGELIMLTDKLSKSRL